jgi:hypothetical protein
MYAIRGKHALLWGCPGINELQLHMQMSMADCMLVAYLPRSQQINSEPSVSVAVNYIRTACKQVNIICNYM